MRGNSHVRFGGRAGETDQPKRWHCAPARPNWEDGGATIPSNLLSLCPFHHRALHLGQFSIDGDPETGTLRFLDPWGNPIVAPDAHPPEPPQSRIFNPPLGERLTANWFTWN